MTQRMSSTDYLKLVSGGSELESSLLLQLRECGVPEPIREYTFHPKRRWRFDMAWPDRMLAVEVEGGTYAHSRHTSGPGFHRDCEKYNTATLHGWRVIRFDCRMVNNGEAASLIQALLDSARFSIESPLTTKRQ